MRILVTGFEAFNGASINPSEILMDRIKKMEFVGKELITLVLPVTMESSFEILKSKIDETKPDVVINFGQANKRKTVTIERIAININDYKINDNEGRSITDEPININGPIAYWATLDVKEIIKRVNDDGFELKISDTAGTYVCNTIMYKTIDYSKGAFKSAFVHIPMIKEQVKDPSKDIYMEMDAIVKVVESIIKSI